MRVKDVKVGVPFRVSIKIAETVVVNCLYTKASAPIPQGSEHRCILRRYNIQIGSIVVHDYTLPTEHICSLNKNMEIHLV